MLEITILSSWCLQICLCSGIGARLTDVSPFEERGVSQVLHKVSVTSQRQHRKAWSSRPLAIQPRGRRPLHVFAISSFYPILATLLGCMCVCVTFWLEKMEAERE